MPVVSLACVDVIPQPVDVTPLDGHVTLRAVTPTVVAADARGAAAAARLLRRKLGGGNADVRAAKSGTGTVRFERSTADVGDEGYELSMTGDDVIISAVAPAGWFYGVQTLLQLMPPSAALPRSKSRGSTAQWRVPCMRIFDRPRFAWRGIMLDVCRHLMPVDGILRMLDQMAAHKLNTFHWHLTDDQGWRIESRRYPKLTEIGAYRRGADGLLAPAATPLGTLPGPGIYGGFYTQDDVRTVVEYAAQRHITVVPEIEMPGHAMSVLAGYGELSCTGGSFETGTRMGVFKDVFCPGNDAVFELLQGVLDEILPLFPGTFVHVGGDECPKDRWRTCPKCQARIKAEGLKDEHELQSYVIRRMEKFLAGRGKRLIGWDEILEGGLAPEATVMSWRGTEGGTAAAQAGHDVVMSPHRYCYLDYAQAEDGEPDTIPDGLLPLEKVYGYEPVPPDLTPDQATHILGIQGNLWTEYVADIEHAEYMLWPRAAAIAEIGWSRADAKDLEDFRRRLVADQERLAAAGVGYRPL